MVIGEEEILRAVAEQTLKRPVPPTEAIINMSLHKSPLPLVDISDLQSLSTYGSDGHDRSIDRDLISN